ncbi:hypothetical protein ACRQ5Q_33190 [Bradyrhizobium sp. PMVTL-01]|uniref:hypothetical protein n=1 Tax=Bradyrhizobium sp. PMVTL-01 TaxID=3434999 RepID=UPI003F7146BD
MLLVAIFSFLVGAVLAGAFRVWIIVPTTLLGVTLAVTVELAHEGRFASAIGHVLLIGALPQFGYAFGLFAVHMLVVLRAPWPTVREARQSPPCTGSDQLSVHSRNGGLGSIAGSIEYAEGDVSDGSMGR